MPGDAGQGSSVDVVALGRAAVTAGDLAGPPPAGVGIGQPGPPRLAQIPGGLGAPVGQIGVKPGHRGLDQPDGGRRERPPGGCALLAQPGRQPQRHRADPSPGISLQDRGVDALGGQERGEVTAQVAQEARQRTPRQQPGGQPGREIPLDRLAQPGRADALVRRRAVPQVRQRVEDAVIVGVKLPRLCLCRTDNSLMSEYVGVDFGLLLVVVVPVYCLVCVEVEEPLTLRLEPLDLRAGRIQVGGRLLGREDSLSVGLYGLASRDVLHDPLADHQLKTCVVHHRAGA